MPEILFGMEISEQSFSEKAHFKKIWKEPLFCTLVHGMVHTVHIFLESN